MAKHDRVAKKINKGKKPEQKAVEVQGAYEAIPDPAGYIPPIPDQEIPESDKTPDWYVKNVKYICAYYNVPTNNVLAPVPYNEGYTDDYNLPVNQMIRYMQYYLGKQQNLDYNHLTQNVTESNLQAPWIKGQDISELVKFMKGNILDRINNVQISARPMSEDAVSEREDMLKKLTMKLDLKPIFDRMKDSGLEFSPANGMEFESHDEIKKWVDEGGFKDVGAEYATDIANSFWYTNYCASKFVQSFNYTTICGATAMHHTVDNGKDYMQLLMPYQLILDTRVDDDYNRDAQFVGVIECLTPTQINARFKNKLSAKQKEDIYEMAKDYSYGAKYNTIPNFSWWNYGSQRQASTVSVVTVYWYGRHDLGLKKKENRFGVKNIGKTEKGEDGEYIVTDVHCATLIGNRYLVDYGYIDNLVEDYTDRSKPLFPILRFMPDMVGGEFISIVGRLHRLQDEIDALNFKIREMIGRAKGKVYIVRGDKLGNNVDVQSMEEDLAKIGMTVVNSTGEIPDGTDRESIIETMDKTLDPGIAQLFNAIQIKSNYMKEVVSTSQVALGQQTTYIGLGTQQATIGQTTFGLKYLYDGFMDFIQHNIQYAINVEGRLMAENDDLETAMVVGDKGKKYLDVMKLKNISWEDILVYVKLNDQIDMEAKKELQQAAFGLIQNDRMNILDWLELRSSNTYTELKNKMKFSEMQRIKKEEEDREKAQREALEIQAQQIQGANTQEALRQAGQDQRAYIKNDALLAQQQAQPQV